MKILQISNLASHHQLPLARALIKIVGELNFKFAATSPYDAERIKNGWSLENNVSWILYPNSNERDLKTYNEFVQDADVVICGDRDFDLFQKRLENGKICMYMSERWFKPHHGLFRLCHPTFMTYVSSLLNCLSQKGFFYLPIGKFAADDIKLLTFLGKKDFFRWGYFTEPFKGTFNNLSHKDKSERCINILWVGRMLRWKRVDLIIDALANMKKKGYFFKLNLVGDGPERSKLLLKAKNLLGVDFFSYSEFIKSDEVPLVMASNHIYVLSSTPYEGWGAVLNEAMSAGCVVVASDKAGAASFLIENHINGFTFKSGSVASLELQVSNAIELFNSADSYEVLINKSIETVNDLWSPQNAAERIVEFSEFYLRNGIPLRYDFGPLSII